MGNLSHKAGVKFLRGFNHNMLKRQAGMDRRVHNDLLEILKAEYRRCGRINPSRRRVNSWYTNLRNSSGPKWLREAVSLMTRVTLYDLVRHYEQYVETESLKAAGMKPYPEYGEPHFRKHSYGVSLPLVITHNNTSGNARFLDGRTIRISKMGDIRMSRPFPTDNYRPKTGRLFQTRDGKWRITISCEVPDPEPFTGTPVVLGVDLNVGNIATPDCLIVPQPKMVKLMKNAEKTASRAQHIASRRQKPDGVKRKPGSKRWAKAQKRAAKKKRRAANIRDTINHKASRVIADSCTHPVFEDILIPNLTASAKGTVENPGKNVAQKSGLNRSILNQGWGRTRTYSDYKSVGGATKIPHAYTSQKCPACGYTDGCNRDGREFVCTLCQYDMHADCNAAKNVENDGARKIGGRVIRGRILTRCEKIANRSAATADNAHVKGRLDAEGSSVGTPMKRQAWTGVRPPKTIVLWDDV